jgi:hypothetical protein
MLITEQYVQGGTKMSLGINGVTPSIQRITPQGITRTASQPVAFAGAPPGINYGQAMQKVQKFIDWPGAKKQIVTIFNNLIKFLKGLGPKLQPANEAISRNASSLWQKIRPVASQAVK